MTRMDLDGTIHYTAGETFNLKLYVDEDNAPIDFLNWQIEFKVFKASATFLTFTNTNYINTSNVGLIIITVPPSAMNLLSGTYLYDLKVTRPDGIVEIWLNNKKFVVEP